MKLREYLTHHGITHAALAADLGLSKEAVRRYASGERIPRPDLMRKIVAATDGAVTLDDLVPGQEAA